jgi:hypothetical protein
MAEVFISHSQSDAGVAGRLAADLQAADVDVWMAPGSIRAGESFAAAIDRGLQGCEFVAVLLSPSAMASSWVLAEVYAALDRAQGGLTRLIPLLLQPVALPPLLSRFQSIDFSDYERGLAALGAALGVDVRPVTDVPVVEALQSRRRETSPPDAFVARVLGALEAGADSFGYACHRMAPELGGALDAVVEVALLRIGVIVQRGKKSAGRLLGEAERELHDNPHDVAAILAVAPGDHATLQHYQLLGAPTPNAVVITWAPREGLDAVPAAVPLVVRLMTSGAPG